MKRLPTVIAVAVLAGCLSFSAMAANNASKEIATALIHANVASKIDTTAGVHLHLHHVLNGVLGAESKQYSAAAEARSANKCKGLGNGALPDVGHNPTARKDLEQAAHAADRSIATNHLAAAHKYADEVVAALKSAQTAMRKDATSTAANR